MVTMAAGFSDGLVGYWPLDGNGKDQSGNGHDAKLENGAKWVNNGWINGAMEVDGNGGHAKDTAKLNSADNEIPHVEQTVINLKFGWDECCGARYFKGIIDEVMIFDRTLSADEITQLATHGLPVESKGKLTTTWAALK